MKNTWSYGHPVKIRSQIEEYLLINPDLIPNEPVSESKEETPQAEIPCSPTPASVGRAVAIRRVERRNITDTTPQEKKSIAAKERQTIQNLARLIGETKKRIPEIENFFSALTTSQQ